MATTLTAPERISIPLEQLITELSKSRRAGPDRRTNDLERGRIAYWQLTWDWIMEQRKQR